MDTVYEESIMGIIHNIQKTMDEAALERDMRKQQKEENRRKSEKKGSTKSS